MTKHTKKENENGTEQKLFRGGERSLWSGSISFGLVNVPVKIGIAIHPKNIRFHLFRKEDHCKVRRKYICETDKKEVPADQIVKGYELDSNRYAMVEEGEIEKLAPKSSREILLMQFINAEEIDPIYYSHAYHLFPEKNGKKAYFLLAQALKKSGKVGIAKFVMRNHQYLAALRIYRDLLCLETMHFHDELIEPKKIDNSSVKISDREVQTALKLIESLTEKFHPEKLYDDYRKSLLNLISHKKKVKTAEAPTEGKVKESEVADLISALEESLRQADMQHAGK